MLPWLRDRTCIALSPDRAVVVRQAPRFLRWTTTRHAVECRPGSAQEPWRAALEALADLPPEVELSSGQVDIVLSNHFARYALVPWDDGIIGQREKLIQAKHCFSQIHGAVANAWSVRLSAGGFRSPSLAAAVDEGLVNGVVAFCNERKLKLHSLQPWSVPAINQVRRRLNSGTNVGLLLVERGRMFFGLFQGEHWAHVTLCRTDPGWTTRIADILKQEIYAAGLTVFPDKTFVHAIGCPDADLKCLGPSFEVLKTPSDTRLPGQPDSGFGIVAEAIC